jgi:potassium/hydrogen antiporter
MKALFAAHATLLFGSALVLFGILSSLAASRFGVPILLVFLGMGMLAGEDGIGGIVFDNYALTYLVGSAALAIILFDGGLRTRTATVRSVLAPAGVLATLGVLATSGLTGLAAKLLLGMGWTESLLIGAIVASTDAAVVFFLLRTGGLQLRRRVGAVLEVESGTNDPFAVLLTVILVEIALAGPTAGEVTHILHEVVVESSLGLAIGLAGGAFLILVLNRITLPAGLHPAFVVAAAVSLFAFAQTLGASGFLAAYVAGLVVGNRPVRAFGSILAFHDTATWLCQIVLFTLLGFLVTPSKIVPLLLPGIALAVFLILVGRPLAVFACLAPFRFSRREMGFISWVGLRGGVSIFLATIPVLAGLPQADRYFNVAFIVVVVSLVVQGWTIGTGPASPGAIRRPRCSASTSTCPASWRRNSSAIPCSTRARLPATAPCRNG